MKGWWEVPRCKQDKHRNIDRKQEEDYGENQQPFGTYGVFEGVRQDCPNCGEVQALSPPSSLRYSDSMLVRSIIKSSTLIPLFINPLRTFILSSPATEVVSQFPLTTTSFPVES